MILKTVFNKSSCLLIALCLCPMSAFALIAEGPGSSGGGNAVVCKDSVGNITSAELLDLYEGRSIYGLQPVPSSAPMLEQALEAAKRIDAGTGSMPLAQIAGLIKRFEESLRMLPKGAGLKPVPDSNHIVIPKTCDIVQLARYEENDLIYVDSDIWQAMDEQNRAALLVHEALYWQLRFYGDSNSDRVRQAVAHAFAGISLQPANAGVPEGAEVCATKFDQGRELPWAAFYTYRDPENPQAIVLQFEFLNGRPVLSKTSTRVYGTQWPLLTSSYDFFSSSKVESLVNSGTGIFIRTTPNASEQTGFIGPAKGLTPPNIPFTCRPVAKTE